jgi:hypothetical protein
MPLPTEAGHALASYLEQARPRCASRAVEATLWGMPLVNFDAKVLARRQTVWILCCRDVPQICVVSSPRVIPCPGIVRGRGNQRMVISFIALSRVLCFLVFLTFSSHFSKNFLLLGTGFRAKWPWPIEAPGL